MRPCPLNLGDVVTTDWTPGEEHVLRRVVAVRHSAEAGSWWYALADGGAGGTPTGELDAGHFRVVARQGPRPVPQKLA